MGTAWVPRLIATAAGRVCEGLWNLAVQQCSENCSQPMQRPIRFRVYLVMNVTSMPN